LLSRPAPCRTYTRSLHDALPICADVTVYGDAVLGEEGGEVPGGARVGSVAADRPDAYPYAALTGTPRLRVRRAHPLCCVASSTPIEFVGSLRGVGFHRGVASCRGIGSHRGVASCRGAGFRRGIGSHRVSRSRGIGTGRGPGTPLSVVGSRERGEQA